MSTRRILLVLALALAACARPGPTPNVRAGKPAVGTVVVVSLDGFRHDYRKLANTPALDRMVATGAHAGRLIPTFPSQTFPSHATLATGVHAGTHGIINNVFRDRGRGLYKHSNDVSWYQSPPLWIWAQQHGLRSHVYHWVGCQGSYKGVVPAFWTPFDKTITDETKVDTVGRWLRAPWKERPRLAMIYLTGCDRVGHMHGPESAEVVACVRRNDGLIGTLMRHVEARQADWPVTLLVVSDHGMTATKGTVNPGMALEEQGVHAEVLATGPVAHVYLPVKALEALTRALEAARKIPHVKVYLKADLPTAWRYQNPSRTGDLVLVASPGVRFDARAKAAYTEERVAGIHGHHGHHPVHPDMGAVLFAWGAGIRKGAWVSRARSVDLFPTVCRLLSLPLPGGLHGRALDEILK